MAEAEPQDEKHCKTKIIITGGITMKKSTGILIGIVALVVIIALWGVSARNSMVSAYEDVQNKASAVETQLQRRSDLIPNFVATVKGYAAHEEEVYTAIADARAKLSGAIKQDDMPSVSEANSELDSALSRLLVVVENYPELQANENFIALQDELAGTENRIAKAREDYNDEVKSYNQKIKSFPNNIIANMGGFDEAEYFEASEGAKDAPTVDFS